MSTSNSGNKTHDDTVRAAEGSRQAAAVAGASQATVRSAEIVFYRSVLASALANGCSPSAAVRALQELGTGGG